MATRGLEVHGVDIRSRLVDSIQNGEVLIGEPGLAVLVSAAVKSGRLSAGMIPKPADFFVIAVPTPFKKTPCDLSKPYREADLSYVENAAKSIVPHLRPGNTVIIESTSPPGTSRDVVAPILAESGLRPGEDFYLAYSPERVIPGAILRELIANDRVVGGLNKTSASRAADLYRLFVEGTIFETDCTTAEMVKLSENTYRDVNIALANELAALCEEVGADVWEVIRMANHHPRVNLHQPGPGVGGHCIAVDPWFLVEKHPEKARLIATARAVNDAQPASVIAMIENALKTYGDGPIAFLGVTYKADVDDVRESPSLEIIKHFVEGGSKCFICDPWVEDYVYPLATDCGGAVAQARYVVILVNHRQFGDILAKDALSDKIVIDTRGVLVQDNLPATTVLVTMGRRRRDGQEPRLQ